MSDWCDTYREAAKHDPLGKVPAYCLTEQVPIDCFRVTFSDKTPTECLYIDGYDTAASLANPPVSTYADCTKLYPAGQVPFDCIVGETWTAAPVETPRVVDGLDVMAIVIIAVTMTALVAALLHMVFTRNNTKGES